MSNYWKKFTENKSIGTTVLCKYCAFAVGQTSLKTRTPICKKEQLNKKQIGNFGGF